MSERSYFALNSQWPYTHLHGLGNLINGKPTPKTGGDGSSGMRAVSWSPRAAVAKYHKLMTRNNRNILSQFWKSEIKVSIWLYFL